MAVTFPQHITATIEVPTPNGGIAAYVTGKAENYEALNHAQAMIDKLQEFIADVGDKFFSEKLQERSMYVGALSTIVNELNERYTGLEITDGKTTKADGTVDNSFVVPAIQLFSATGKQYTVSIVKHNLNSSDIITTVPSTTTVERAANTAGWGVPPMQFHTHDFGSLSRESDHGFGAIPPASQNDNFADRVTESRQSKGGVER